MGLDVQSLRLLLVARRMGVKFDQTLTLGRQDLLMTPHQLRTVCKAFELVIDEAEARHIAVADNRFADPMLKKLGAASVDSMDASGFEGASIIHDLNYPIPPGIAGQFSVVFDGGTLEHVFDFPKAIRSCMELPAVGGHFIMTSPANNQMGHGFYQFGPDLFYRVFSPENGYQLKALFLVPTWSDGDWFKVLDPALVGGRIGHNWSLKPLSLFAIAQRISVVPIFTRTPQQSDYVAEWTKLPKKGIDGSRLRFFDEATALANRAPTGWGRIKRLLRILMPRSTWNRLRAWRDIQGANRPPNPAHFERFPLPPE